MSKRETAQATLGQVWELLGDIIKFLGKLFSGLSAEQLQLLVSQKKRLFNGFRDVVEKVLGVADNGYRDLVAEWQKFYSEVFGLTVDLSGLVAPPKPEGDWWLIVVVPGITYNQLMAALRRLFPVWVYADDLDKAIDMAREQRRAIDKPYAIWVRANVEADPDNTNKSANDLGNTPQITLMERLLLEGVYFRRVGKHLDARSYTLCAGSHHSDGHVPSVHWDGSDDKLAVHHDGNPDSRGSDLRSRSVS